MSPGLKNGGSYETCQLHARGSRESLSKHTMAAPSAIAMPQQWLDRLFVHAVLRKAEGNNLGM